MSQYLRAEYLAYIPFLPLLGALILGLFHARLSRISVHAIALSSVAGSFIITLFAFKDLLAGNGFPLVHQVAEWMQVGRFTLPFELMVDHVSICLMLVITGVGFVIHVYSMGYMSHDQSFARYFCYLNLFVFFMLILVMAKNLVVLFVGWEGVGLCSYLLIGFWYSDEHNAAAGKKAFIVNRIGDAFFLIGIFIMLGYLRTVDFLSLQDAIKYIGNPDSIIQNGFFQGVSGTLIITVMTLCLFIGATGKSAQIPLFVWLPDAMAGPTPVSALIHAATMVTAGIYMITRLNFLFVLSPLTMEVIATIGVLTAFVAATIGMVQNNLKKVLAYSTISQLGFMFLALGVGAFTAAIFHLITHAFFKACLFLGAGSVMHGMHDEQDIWEMGGLKSKMPQTFFTFLFSTLAIAGIPPLSGFFSKDEILSKTFFSGHYILWALASLTAFLTALYMGRLTFSVFFGKLRTSDHHKRDGIHESPFSMTIPLIILALLAVIGGFIGIPHVLGGHHVLEGFLQNAHLHESEIVIDEHQELLLMGLSAFLGVLGLSISFFLYALEKNTMLLALKKLFSPLYCLFSKKWYVETVYDLLIVKVFTKLSGIFWKVFDQFLIDFIIVRLPGQLLMQMGNNLHILQRGTVQGYLLAFLVGIVSIMLWLFFF